MKSRKDFFAGDQGNLEYREYLVVYFTGLNVAKLIDDELIKNVIEAGGVDYISQKIKFAIITSQLTVDQLFKTPTQ